MTKDQREAILKKFNNVEWDGEGNPLYSEGQMLAAMEELETIVREKEKAKAEQAFLETISNQEMNLAAASDLIKEYKAQAEAQPTLPKLPVSGMRWVKASEPPKNSDLVHVRYGFDGKTWMYKDVAYYEEGRWLSVSDDKPLPKLFLNTLEWLEEEAALASDAVAAERDELLSALEGLMEWCVNNVDRWHFPQYDHCANIVSKVKAPLHRGEGGENNE